MIAVYAFLLGVGFGWAFTEVWDWLREIIEIAREEDER